MSQNNDTKPYHSLIHLGCGAVPNLDEYLGLAGHVWLIDADSQVLDKLGKIAHELENVHVVQALADTEQRSGIFYRYSLPWANGPVPLDESTQRLYPGLRSQGSEEQATTAVDTLLSQCLPEVEESGTHLLLLDVGNYNSTLLQALENSGLLSRLATVIVLPAHRRQKPVPVPPSLHSVETSPKGLTLPSNSQMLKLNPLLLELEQDRKQLAESEVLHQKIAHQLDETTDLLRKAEEELENRTQERDQVKQQLAERDRQLAERSQQVEETKRAALEQAEKHAQALTAEQEKTAQLAKERDQYLSQRDEEWNKGERLTKERDDLKGQLGEALKRRDEALHHNHLNVQAKNALEARVAELEEKLAEADRFRQAFLSSPEANAARVLADGFYRALEDRFRGSRESIKQRVSVYLPFVRPIAERHPGVPVLDLGCGRGEWLEILKEAEIAGHGIDQDAGMLDGCQALGLSVEQGDAIAYLRTQPDASRICISLIHVVEHIPFDMLRATVEAAKRVLVPDGILIMETPNPENYTVGSCTFYMDPTHRNPLPPPLLAFVPEFYGFERIKVLRLQESPEIHHKEHFEIIDYLSGISPDYAVIAQSSVAATKTEGSEEQQIWEREYGISFFLMAKKNLQAPHHHE